MSDLVANTEDVFSRDAAHVLLCVQKCTHKDRNKTVSGLVVISCAHSTALISNKSNAIEIIIYLRPKVTLHFSVLNISILFF